MATETASEEDTEDSTVADPVGVAEAVAALEAILVPAAKDPALDPQAVPPLVRDSTGETATVASPDLAMTREDLDVLTTTDTAAIAMAADSATVMAVGPAATWNQSAAEMVDFVTATATGTGLGIAETMIDHETTSASEHTMEGTTIRGRCPDTEKPGWSTACFQPCSGVEVVSSPFGILKHQGATVFW